MKTIPVSKEKLKNFLAERLTRNVLQADETELYHVIRHEAIGGFNRMDDKQLCGQMFEAIPEFELCEFAGTDEKNIFISLKPQYSDNEENILVDIKRVIQTKII